MLSSSKYVSSYHHTAGFVMGIIIIVSANIIPHNPVRAHHYL